MPTDGNPMLTKNLPKVTAADLAVSDGLLGDTAARGTALITLEEAMKFLDSKRGYHSNPNLLINSDFRKPVNRNGGSEYVTNNAGVHITLDCWRTQNGTIIINNDYITCSSLTRLFQRKGHEISRDRKYTISVLTQDNKLYTAILPFDKYIYLGGINVGCFYETNDVYIVNAQASNVSLVAAKLEEGSFQTLAHKEGDIWILNDPPNYDLQYALCSQYSSSTGEFVGSQHSNPNLLDNAYWASKAAIVNQRGQDEYTTKGYTIDRWLLTHNDNVTILEDRITLSLRATASFRQLFEEAFYKQLTDRNLTFSILLADNTLISDTKKLNTANNSWDANQFFKINNKIRVILTQSTGFMLYASEVETLQIKAMKLEFGSVQTLAHKEGDTWVLNDPPPDYATELAKCQRYAIVGTLIGFRTFQLQSINIMQFFFPLPITMRVNSAISSNKITLINELESNGAFVEAAIESISVCNNGLYVSVNTNNVPQATFSKYTIAKITPEQIVSADL